MYFCFVKQKTAYEMRISDWSSDVCSSDLVDSGAIIPEPPPLTLALPATILLGHPNVVAAEREAAARWAEIGVARADRLPRIDLVGLLTGNWIRLLGSTTDRKSTRLNYSH